MKESFIRDFRSAAVNTIVNGVFAVSEKEAMQPYKNGYFFTVRVSDKTGNIKAKFWGGIKEEVVKIYDSFDKNDIIFLSGTINIYNNELEISINPISGRIRKANDGEYSLDDFICSTNKNVDDMEKELRGTIDEIDKTNFEGKFLKALLLKFFDDADFMEKFRKWPGAVMYHHACLGGLMEHTLEVVKLCRAMCDIHPTGIDKDLAITGAILHDIGKTKTITITAIFQNNEEDLLRNHISISEEMVIKKIDEIEIDGEKFPENLRSKLLHIILSHHGEKDRGSPVEPVTPEAIAVYVSDLFSSLTTQYIRAQKDTDSDDFKVYQRPIGWVHLDSDKKEKLLKHD